MYIWGQEDNLLSDLATKPKITASILPSGEKRGKMKQLLAVLISLWTNRNQVTADPH